MQIAFMVLIVLFILMTLLGIGLLIPLSFKMMVVDIIFLGKVLVVCGIVGLLTVIYLIEEF